MVRGLLWRLSLVVGAQLSGCAGGEIDTAPGSGGGHSCAGVEEKHPEEGNAHFGAGCETLVYRTNPPSSGDHCPYWTAYKVYEQPVPRGVLVHNLEHGAVVVGYNCLDGCDADIARIRDWVASLPPDPVCGVKRRLIVAPDPKLDVRFAAAAWQFTLRADCFEPEAFTTFYGAHLGHALEDVCTDGIDFGGK